jgi:transcriptional regulator with XRE-family HTH domain
MFGAAAKQARRRLELTQADVAERAGVSVEFYARIERAASVPSAPTLLVLARILGLSLDPITRGVSTAASDAEPPDFYRLGSPLQRRVYRQLRQASPAALRLVAEVLRSFEQAVREPRPAARRGRSAGPRP